MHGVLSICFRAACADPLRRGKSDAEWKSIMPSTSCSQSTKVQVDEDEQRENRPWTL